MKTMEWDWEADDPNYGGWRAEYGLEEGDFSGCCRYMIVHDFPISLQSEHNHWLALCELLQKASKADENILVALSVPSQQKMVDLLEATPYWIKLDEVQNASKKGCVFLYRISVK
jgi:hypothetical protein